MLLDLGLPDVDGFEVCRRLRARSEVPIIVVTARGDEVDRVVGLELGADDYIVKPFGFRELLARIRAVTRRAQARPEDLAPRVVGALTHRPPHPPGHAGGGEPLALTPKEFDLLALLADEPGTVFTRAHILEEVWDAHWYGPTKTLDVHVAALRKKLGDPAWIETVRGVGFRLVESPATTRASRSGRDRTCAGACCSATSRSRSSCCSCSRSPSGSRTRSPSAGGSRARCSTTRSRCRSARRTGSRATTSPRLQRRGGRLPARHRRTRRGRRRRTASCSPTRIRCGRGLATSRAVPSSAPRCAGRRRAAPATRTRWGETPAVLRGPDRARERAGRARCG